jgi:hypothetical protein
MSDPRNVAHDKKVIQEKKHHGEAPVEGAAETVQPGKKPTMEKHDGHEDPATERVLEAADKAEAAGVPDSASSTPA